MGHCKKCLCCGKEFQGQISKIFCGDACRKRFRRKGGVIPIDELTVKQIAQIHQSTEEKTDSKKEIRNPIHDYALKKIIQVGASFLENKLKQQNKEEKKNVVLSPLQIKKGISKQHTSIVCELSAEMKEFIGNITYPFKMLVWGLPGEGKSTFCMKLAGELSRQHGILYIMSEESLEGTTFIDKQQRVLEETALKNITFANRLPVSQQEWKELIICKPRTGNPYTENVVSDKTLLAFSSIFYDSVTKMNIDPFYVDELSGKYAIEYFKNLLSHVFIAHAQKDGQTYRGDGSWGHEVDIIIRCEKGIAITEKNRFGLVGNRYKIY